MESPSAGGYASPRSVMVEPHQQEPTKISLEPPTEVNTYQETEEQHPELDQNEDEDEDEEEEEVSLLGRNSRSSRLDISSNTTTTTTKTETSNSNGTTTYSTSSSTTVEHLNGPGVDNGSGHHSVVAGSEVSPLVPLKEDHGGDHFHMHSSIYFDEPAGTEVANEVCGSENGDADNPVEENPDIEIKFDAQNGFATEGHHFEENSLLKGFPRYVNNGENGLQFDSKTREIANLDVIEEVEPELEDFDVEKVLEKQETHDLFCPNCHSCITRRVILRKRKRHDTTKESKRERLGIKDTDGFESSSPVNVIPAPAAAADPDYDREPEVFRCFSCFSFFIPTGKLFRRPREPSETRNLLNHQMTIPTKKSWIFSLFTADEKETSTDEDEDEDQDNGEATLSVQDTSLSESFYGVDTLSVVPATQENLKIEKDTTISSSETHVNKVTVESDGNYQKTTTVNTHSSNISSATEQATSESTSTSCSSSAVQVNSATNETISSGKDVTISSSEIHGKEGTAASNVDSRKTTTSKTSWFSSGFPLKKKQPTIEQVLNTPLLDKLDGSSEPVANTTPVKNEVSRESINVKSQQNGKGSLSSQAVESLLPNEFKTNGDTDMGTKNVNGMDQSDLTLSRKEEYSPVNAASTKPLERENDVSSLSIKGSSSSVQPSYDMKLLHEVTTTSLEVRVDSEPINDPGPLLRKSGHEVKSSVQLDDIVNCEIKEDKVTIVVDSGTAEASDSRRHQNLVPIQSDTILQGGRQYEANKGRQLEILKSIVYGGLIECITSLGVVSSAAGSGASTLNILVLGMANLVGGLIIIAHSLREMKIASNETISNQSNEQESRYQELLGKRENFRLHAFIAILSFIVFGLVPPVVYGFSFQNSNDHYSKLATALAASIVCIMLLAIGKSHVRKSPKSYIKTLLYYTSIGLAVPGISYVVGDYVSHFIEKLGWFDPSSAATDLFVAKSLNAGFAAY